MIGQDLPEEYEEKKDDSGRPETGRSDRKKKRKLRLQQVYSRIYRDLQL